MIRSSMMIAAALSIALIGAQARADEPAPALLQAADAPVLRPWQPHHRLLAQTTIIEPSAPPRATIVTTTPGPLPSTEVEYHPRTGLIIGGLVTFGVSYAATVVASSLKQDDCESQKPSSPAYICRTQTWPLVIPLAGPFIQMGYVDGTGRNTVRTLLAIDGVVQISGAVMAVVGIVASNEPAKVTQISVSDHVYLTPIASREGSGIAAAGVF